MLPSAAALRTQVSDYLSDSEKLTSACIKKATRSQVFADIYRVALSTHTVLGGLAGVGLQPTFAPARGIAVRIPLLVSIGQSSVANSELRRFVELIVWTVYFSDHPVEWHKFLENRNGGFVQDTRLPISYAAHRQLNAYIEYAHELMSTEPSGLGAASVEGIRQAVRDLNSMVHAGRLARELRRLPPHDDLSESSLRSFLRIQRATFSNSCVLLSAYRRKRFDKLDAVSRAYFDWLVGPKIRRTVRAGPFGLP